MWSAGHLFGCADARPSATFELSAGRMRSVIRACDTLAVTGRSDAPAMDATSEIEFTLTPAGRAPVAVRLRRRHERWLAEVSGSAFAAALGSTAREALTAAFQPLGDAATRLLLADLGLLAPSIAVLELDSIHLSA